MAKACPKCTGSMEEGFILDYGDSGAVHSPKWQPGEPKKSFWTGVKQNKGEQLQVSTYRCKRCGFLESYAVAP